VPKDSPEHPHTVNATPDRPLYPLFLADWLGALFVHYTVDPDILQAQVPYPLDLHEEETWVSLVVFDLKRMRHVRWPRLTQPLFGPTTTTRFLNVRTYVRYRDEPGIFFLGELLSNLFSVPLGQPAFGLPYHAARFDCDHGRNDRLRGSVGKGHSDREFRYSGKFTADGSGSTHLREFLLERYTAFTLRDNQRGRFRIAHAPWEAESVDLAVHDDRLLDTTGRWYHGSRFHSSHFSPGVRDVVIGKFRFADE
jgi:uncharacterized protein